MIKLPLYVFFVITTVYSFGQTFATEKGSVYFNAKTDKGIIDAQNNNTQVEISFDTKTINASLFIKDFNFKN